MPKGYVVLDCGHTVQFAEAHMPQKGDELWCYRHRSMEVVTEAPPIFRWKCARCSTSRSFPGDRSACEASARGHRSRTGHPRVRIYDGRKLIYIQGDDPGQPSLLNTDGSVNPRAEAPRPAPF